MRFIWFYLVNSFLMGYFGRLSAFGAMHRYAGQIAAEGMLSVFKLSWNPLGPRCIALKPMTLQIEALGDLRSSEACVRREPWY